MTGGLLAVSFAIIGLDSSSSSIAVIHTGSLILQKFEGAVSVDSINIIFTGDKMLTQTPSVVSVSRDSDSR